MKICKEGYTVTYTPAKQTGHTVTKDFIIPRSQNPDVVCFASVIDQYLADLRKDQHGNLTEDSPLFYTGRKPTKTGKSVYVNSALGENEMKNTGKYIARILGYPDADEYTGNFKWYLFFTFVRRGRGTDFVKGGPKNKK